MARARNIKPGFFRNADLVECSIEARLLFIGLWTMADRAGRLDDRPKQIRMELFPADNVDCDACLFELAGAGMIVRYVVDGKRFIEVTNFVKHQTPHHLEKRSVIPAPPNAGGKPDLQPVEKHDEQGESGANLGLIQDKPEAEPGQIHLNPDSLNPDSLNPEPTHTEVSEPGPPTDAGRVCRAMKSEGVGDVSPGHPKLLALIEAGAADTEFCHAARVAVNAGAGFAYALGVVAKQREEAAVAVRAGIKGPLPRGSPKRSFAQEQREQLARLTGSAERNERNKEGVIDGVAERVD